MMNKNQFFLNSFVEVPDDVFNKLQKISIFKKVEANTGITRAGEIPSVVYMLTSGLMGAFLNSECGKIYNKNLFMPYSFVGALTALINNKPSEFSYQALTDCKGYEINFNALKDLCKKEIVISHLYNKILEKIFVAYEKRQIEIISLNATQRYLKLRHKIPNIDDLIPQFQIASYLGITPVQLSRIRKEINSAILN